MCAAPKGNQYAVGNSGRPKLFESVEILQEKVEEYFSICDSHEVDTGERDPETNEKLYRKAPKPYSVSGLCVYLDIDRRTLLNYEKEEGYEEFFRVIKMARERISADLIERGLIEGRNNNSALTIFLLKNQGYTDKQEIEHSGGIVWQEVKTYEAK